MLRLVLVVHHRHELFLAEIHQTIHLTNKDLVCVRAWHVCSVCINLCVEVCVFFCAHFKGMSACQSWVTGEDSPPQMVA